MKMSTEIAEIATALLEAQRAIKPPAKAHTGQARGGKYQYADLSDVFDAIRGPLSDNGLAITQGPSVTDAGAVLTTLLLHKSGQWIEATYPLPSNVGSQEMGSAITYGRRYSLCALLGISGEDDDDGAAASHQMTPQPRTAPRPQQPAPAPKQTAEAPPLVQAAMDAGGRVARITEPQVKRLWAMASEAGITEAQVYDALGKWNLEHVHDLSPALYDDLTGRMQRRIDSAKAGATTQEAR